MSLQWFCYRCHQGKDRFAKLNLENQGFEVYMPLYLAGIKAREPQVKLFLPGYGFIRFDPDYDRNSRWRAVLSTFGIKSVICSGEKPQPVGDWIIEGIKEREVDGMVRLAPKEVCKLEKGQVVRLRGSPLDAVFEEVADHQRAYILIKIFDRQYRKLAPISKLVAVSSAGQA